MHRAAAIVFALVVTGSVATPPATCAADDLSNQGPFDAALAAARKVVPESSMIDARLIKRGDSAIYEILLIDVDGVLHTVRVDAVRSRVLDRFDSDEQRGAGGDDANGDQRAPGGKRGGRDPSGKDGRDKGDGRGRSGQRGEGGQGDGRQGDGRQGGGPGGEGSRGKGN